jgi:hypothetical protein
MLMISTAAASAFEMKCGAPRTDLGEDRDVVLKGSREVSEAFLKCAAKLDIPTTQPHGNAPTSKTQSFNPEKKWLPKPTQGRGA